MSSSPNAVSCIFVFLKKLNCHKLSLFACNVTFYLTLKWASLPSQDFIIIQQHFWWSHASIALCETKFFCIDKKIKESSAPSSVNEQKQISFCHKFNFCCWYGPVLMEQFSHNEMFFVGQAIVRCLSTTFRPMDRTESLLTFTLLNELQYWLTILVQQQVFSLTGMDNIKQDDMLAFVCRKAAQSKPVKLAASRTYFPLQ